MWGFCGPWAMKWVMVRTALGKQVGPLDLVSNDVRTSVEGEIADQACKARAHLHCTGAKVVELWARAQL